MKRRKLIFGATTKTSILLTLLLTLHLFVSACDEAPSSGLESSPKRKDKAPSSTTSVIDPQTPANVKPFMIDSLLPAYSQSFNWDVAFSDEFNDSKIDMTKWSVENVTKYKTGISIISNDQQVEEKDRNINIYYRKSKEKDDTYYTGRFNSKNKFATTYGYFECRMSIPRPDGYQVAFWMMPLTSLTPNGVTDGTANDGAEIDIIEACKLSDSYSSGLHWDGYGKSHKGAGGHINAPGLHAQEYHVFGLEWSPTCLRFYYDGKVERTITDPIAIPIVAEYIIFSGSMWAEKGWVDMSVKDNTLLNSGGTAKASIDYVRVFKNRATYPPMDQLPENFTENTIVMDNADTTGVIIIGDWVRATNSTPYYKKNYFHDNNQNKGLKEVSFNPALKQSGKYEIYAYSPSETSRATTTKYIIKTTRGDKTVVVDQTKNGSVWISLGQYNLLNDNNPKVIISNANTSGYVVVDAVAFVPIY